MKRSRRLLPAVVALLLLAGCLILGLVWQNQARFVDADQSVRGKSPGVPLEPGAPAGQTFVARHDGLAGIEFYLLPTGDTAATVTLHLRAEPQAASDLATATLQLPPNAEPGFYRFDFAPMAGTHGQYAYAFLESEGPALALATAEGDRYLDGAAYQAHQPLDAQTAFRLVYAPGFMALDLIKAVLGWAVLVAVSGLIFVVPGWALLAWFWPGRRLSWAEMLGLSVGVSLALYPLLLLWTDLVGLHLGSLYAWLPIAGGLAALVWRYRTWRPQDARDGLQQWARSKALWPDLVLLIVLALVFGVRLLVIRTLDAPLWGDSYQHTMVAQLLLDNGGLFDSWEPYAGIDRFTYHFGFHSTVAALHWLTRLPVVETTLWAGQLLNALAVLAVYPLAVYVAGSRWGGVWAVLLAGLLSPMPMFYTNWGRYTQLAGLVILPAAIWLTWQMVETLRRHRSLVALAALVGGGLALTHYRVLLFYAIFVLALALVSFRRGVWRETLLRLGWASVGAVLLSLPWYLNALGGNFARILGRQLTTGPDQLRSFAKEYNTVGKLETYLSPLWWLAMLLGLAVGLWRRRRGVLLVGLWLLLLLIAANPAWLSLPGTGVITNLALFITVYLPASLLAGFLIAYVMRLAAGRKGIMAFVMLLIVVLGIWGARQRLGDLDPLGHTLVTHPDVRAADWIQENTSPEARFLINSFYAYGGSLIVGGDAGWWLPLLAGRQNTVPPLLYGTELERGSDYRQQVEELARQMHTGDLNDPAMLDLLQEQQITHVYVGQRQGQVNYNGSPVLDPEKLLNSPYYRLAYHQDRVWVFEISIPE